MTGPETAAAPGDGFEVGIEPADDEVSVEVAFE